MSESAPSPDLAADFVERFVAYWRAPSLDGLDAVLAPQARLLAPMTKTTHTLAEGKRTFAALLRLAPDLTAEVHRWGPTADGVLIEFTISGSVSGVPIGWSAVDRFVLGADGLATERVSYFDSGTIVSTLLRHPRTWPAFARSRLLF
jgi:SnoaL-like domain